MGSGLADKLMGQVNLALAARDALRDVGSITLIAGVLSETPIVAGSSASMVNAAIEAFARAAAIELPRACASTRSARPCSKSMGSVRTFFRGFDPVPAARAARAFFLAASRVGRPGRSTGSFERDFAEFCWRLLATSRRGRRRICALARARSRRDARVLRSWRLHRRRVPAWGSRAIFSDFSPSSCSAAPPRSISRGGSAGLLPRAPGAQRPCLPRRVDRDRLPG